MELRQLLRAGAGDQAEHRVLVGEPHLTLGRVDVHIQATGRDAEPQRGGGEASRGEQVPVRLAQGLGEHRALDPAPVDQVLLAVARGARVLRESQQRVQSYPVALGVDLEPLLGMARAPQGAGALAD